MSLRYKNYYKTEVLGAADKEDEGYKPKDVISSY